MEKIEQVERYNGAYASAEEFRQDIKESIMRIADFVYNTNFHSVVDEMRSLPVEKHRTYVRNVIINKNELKKRNIDVPDDLIVQRSVFADNRPTLFCLTKYLKDGLRKVTITFDENWQ